MRSRPAADVSPNANDEDVETEDDPGPARVAEDLPAASRRALSEAKTEALADRLDETDWLGPSGASQSESGLADGAAAVEFGGRQVKVNAGKALVASAAVCVFDVPSENGEGGGRAGYTLGDEY